MSMATTQPVNSEKSDDIDFSLNTDDIANFAISIDPENEIIPKKTANKPRSNNKSAAKKQTDPKQNNSRTKELKLPYKIVAAPAGIPVVEYTINPTKLTCFSGGAHYLSTFYKSQFEVNGVRYQSVEEYYQATKLFALCGHQNAAKLQYIREPFKIKQTAKEIIRQCRVPSSAIESWKRSDGIITLVYAIGSKFIQNPQMRDKLMNTKDTLIVQTHSGDNLFAVGMNQTDFEKWAGEHSNQTIKLPYSINESTIKHFPLIGKGQNLLGVILMKVRQELMLTTVADLYNRDSVNQILMRLAK
ncbi:DUF1768 domain-containing protein [Aphelenchoides bicaudatus]|nr:DUF1768 domain-containing protein [Aphelenchoides bicaudatus]